MHESRQRPRHSGRVSVWPPRRTAVRGESPWVVPLSSCVRSTVLARTSVGRPRVYEGKTSSSRSRGPAGTSVVARCPRTITRSVLLSRARPPMGDSVAQLVVLVDGERAVRRTFFKVLVRLVVGRTLSGLGRRWTRRSAAARCGLPVKGRAFPSRLPATGHSARRGRSYSFNGRSREFAPTPRGRRKSTTVLRCRSISIRRSPSEPTFSTGTQALYTVVCAMCFGSEY